MSFFDIMSLVGAFVVIVAALALLYYVSRWYTKRMGGAGGGRYVKIIDRTPLSPGSSVCIAKIGKRYYMLGISDKAVSMLGELPDFEEREETPGQAGASFSQIMRGAMRNREDSGERK
jgi:flagellar biosynthetic protein FliO